MMPGLQFEAIYQALAGGFEDLTDLDRMMRVRLNI